jgi:cytochrome b
MTEVIMKAVPVWDLPTRLFHWLLALSVGTNLIVEPRGDWQFPVHVTAGCMALALVLFRLVWGFIGSTHSLFADFVRAPGAVLQHVRGLLKLRAEPHTGHNPLGGWMVVVLLAMTLVTATTGLFSATRRGQGGPFAGLLGGEGLSDVHGALGNIMIFLVILHLCGVALHYLVARDNIIGAMLTGRKRLDAGAGSAEPPLVSAWRAAIPAALAVALGAWLWSQAHFAAVGVAGVAPSPPAVTGTAN